MASFRSLSVMAAITALSIPGAQAALRTQAAHSKARPEVYAAVDQNQVTPYTLSADDDAPPAPPAPAPAPAVKPAPARPAAPTAAPLPAARHGFDTVPSEHRDSIARRLGVVEKLIRDHGRAYDYRVMTLTELEAIQRDLDEKAMAPAAE